MFQFMILGAKCMILVLPLNITPGERAAVQFESTMQVVVGLVNFRTFAVVQTVGLVSFR